MTRGDKGTPASADGIGHGGLLVQEDRDQRSGWAAVHSTCVCSDDIDRLVNLDRGDLNANKDAISGTPVREEDFGLDATGNWTGYLQKTSGTTDLDQDRTQNKVNETTAITATTGTNWADPVYDATGNMTTAPKPSSLANTLTCTYDAWYRLVEVKQGQTVLAKYEYDCRNRRAKKHLDSQSPGNPDGIDAYVHYFYNGEWQILETRHTTTESAEPENLQPKHQYVWSPRYVDAVVLRDENTDQDGLCDDQRLYYLDDANFNVTALVDTAGDAVERYLYDAYGAMSVMDGDFASRASSSYATLYTYTGREFDGETGLYHYRNRYYHAQMGGFVSRDPIGYDAEDFNLYRYCGNDPLTQIDLSGLCSKGSCINTCSVVWAATAVGCIVAPTAGCVALCGGGSFWTGGWFFLPCMRLCMTNVAIPAIRVCETWAARGLAACYLGCQACCDP